MLKRAARLRCIVGIVTIDCIVVNGDKYMVRDTLTALASFPVLHHSYRRLQYEIMRYSFRKRRWLRWRTGYEANLHCYERIVTMGVYRLGKRSRLGVTRDLCVAITCRPSALTHDQFNALSFRCGRVLLEEGQVTQYC